MLPVEFLKIEFLKKIEIIEKKFRCFFSLCYSRVTSNFSLFGPAV